MTKDLVKIKGTKNGLLIYLEAATDFNLLKKELQTKLSSSGGFFKGAKFTLKPLGPELPIEYLAILNEICTDYGLIASTDITIPHPVKEQLSATTYEETTTDLPNTKLELRFQTQGILNEEELTPTIFLKTGLRSGQKVHFQGNVTILGDVNPGAEIIATGNIIIMGTLRGIAHAGALGNQKAMVVAYRLQPNQLRIANSIGRSPDQANVTSLYPEIAHIVDDHIIIEEYMTMGMKNKKSLKA